jgi:hypothetical protein
MRLKTWSIYSVLQEKTTDGLFANLNVVPGLSQSQFQWQMTLGEAMDTMSILTVERCSRPELSLEARALTQCRHVEPSTFLHPSSKCQLLVRVFGDCGKAIPISHELSDRMTQIYAFSFDY